MIGPISFVILSNNSETLAELRGALAGTGRTRLLGAGNNTEQTYLEVANLRPAAAIIEIDAQPESSLALIGRINAAHPDTVIICASRNSSPDLILRSLRAGAREFLRLPVIGEEFGTVLDRTEAICAGHKSETKKRGRMITVFSSKGGSGVSFVATNLAAAMQAPTALVDLNLQAGDLDLFLGVESKFSIADLIKNRARLDDSLLKSYLTPHSTRLSLLASPHEAAAADDIEPSQVFDAIEVLRERHDYVIIDPQHTFDGITLTALDQADDIILLLTLDIPSIRSAQRALVLFDRLGYPRQKVRVVVNRMSKQIDLDVPQVERFLGEKVFGTIHNDYRMVVNSINLGKPLVESQPTSAAAADLKRIVAGIVRNSAQPLQAEPRKKLFGSMFRREAVAPTGLELRITSD